jgi:sodium/bile acid cotransporter 7
MAKVLLASSTVSMVLLPLMLFHQIQLLVCAVLASRYAKRQSAMDAFGKNALAEKSLAKNT